jgi:hypothetical protein
MFCQVTFGEVKGEGWLISSKIIDMEDKFFRQVLLVPPNDPSNTSIDQSIFVPTDIDTLHQWQPEIPLELRVYKRCNEATAGRIDMDRSIPTTEEKLRIKQKVDSKHISPGPVPLR